MIGGIVAPTTGSKAIRKQKAIADLTAIDSCDLRGDIDTRPF